MAYYDKLLKDDEDLVRVIRSFPVIFFWPVLLGLIFLVSPFFFAVPLFKAGIMGSIVFGLLVLIGFVLLIRSVTIAYFNSLVITTKRVIDWDQRGLFDKVISEADYDKIQDISYRVKGLLGTMFNYGTIQIQTASSTLVLELRFVRRPQKTQTLITDIKRNYKDSDSGTD